MIKALALAVTLVLLGNAVAANMDAPVPGAALGLLLLAGYFCVRGGLDEGTARLFDFAAPHFPLFFVPAAAGVVASGEMLAHSWIHVAAAIGLGTAITMIVTGVLAQALLRRQARRAREVRALDRGAAS